MFSTTTPTTRRRTAGLLAVAAAATGGLVLAPGTAHAADRAKVVVTITAQGTDMSGTVISKRRDCKDQRTVVVYRQVGRRGGGDDVAFASDDTEVVEGKGVWSTGNTGETGKFYAKVKATPDCAMATSPTIRIVEL